VLAVDEPRQEQAAEPAQLARWLSRAHRRSKVIARAGPLDMDLEP
jgi:hypothetical protein